MGSPHPKAAAAALGVVESLEASRTLAQADSIRSTRLHTNLHFSRLSLGCAPVWFWRCFLLWRGVCVCVRIHVHRVWANANEGARRG